MTDLLWVAVPLTLLAALVPLTAVGARRRGNPWVVAVLAGAVFPLTWVWWYVSDEMPARRRGPRDRVLVTSSGRQQRFTVTR